MGYRSIQDGIMRRFLREEGAWSSHLNNTRESILKLVEEKRPKSVRILGSGWLLDIPIQDLVKSCETIILVDILHPPQIVNRYSKFKNIIFEKRDITNGIVDICYAQKRNGFNFDGFINQLANIKTNDYDEDIVISVNLLSQLSIMLTDYLSTKLKLTNDQIVTITEIIQQKHVESLPVNRSLIITDFEEEYYDEDDKLLGSKPTIFIPIVTNSSRKEWSWNFDTKMFYKEDCKTKLRVVALRL